MYVLVFPVCCSYVFLAAMLLQRIQGFAFVMDKGPDHNRGNSGGSGNNGNNGNSNLGNNKEKSNNATGGQLAVHLQEQTPRPAKKVVPRFSGFDFRYPHPSTKTNETTVCSEPDPNGNELLRLIKLFKKKQLLDALKSPHIGLSVKKEMVDNNAANKICPMNLFAGLPHEFDF